MALKCAPMVTFWEGKAEGNTCIASGGVMKIPLNPQAYVRWPVHLQLKTRVATKPCQTSVEEDWKVKQRQILKNQVQPAILQGAKKSWAIHVFFHQSCIRKTIKGDLLLVNVLQVKLLYKFLLCCKAKLQSHMQEHEFLKTSAAYDWLRSIPSLKLHWKRKTVTFIFGLVMAGVLLMVGAPVTAPNPVTWALTEENLIFLEAWRTIDRAYIDKTFNGKSWFRYREEALRREPMNNREQTYAAIRKMLLTLEDPFTRFLEPEKFKTLRTGTRGAVTGVGLEVGFDSSGVDANLVVIAPVIGGPAERAGIVPGDIISKIDGVSTTGMGLYDAAQRLQGPESSEVKLTVQKKQSGSSNTFSLVRERIKINPVSWRLCEVEQEGKEAKQIGYIRLATFNENASRSIKEAIQKLKESGATAFILDMRNNSGGLFPAGVEIARMWLEKGVIVYITDSMGVRDIYEADGTGTLATEEPLAVLVNKGTASASEILAGALKDNKRATILGEPTFGKGKIQSVFELSDGSGMAVTIARYETPAHVDIDKVNRKPDAIVNFRLLKM
ncbi:hypothetical protein GOP47_0005309 [Adiantum capillus-veneris]|uniref:C-terminal processing peptidase n=1 Tax=Adiantum capillus-veneris TaxID=13818 RepID=A0A9D4V4V3_ADICA|nr:hypothetical protein GOP47_0005309 [Adiantum capillus-veneris]